jgi:O-antigen ligase
MGGSVVVLISALTALVALKSRLHALGIMIVCVVNHGIFVLCLGDAAIKLPLLVCGGASLVLLLKNEWRPVSGAYLSICGMFLAWLFICSAVANIGSIPIGILVLYVKAVMFSLLIAGFLHARRDFGTMAVYLALSVLIASSFNIWQGISGHFLLENTWAEERGRAAGARGDPNDTAMVIMTGIPVIWSMMAAENRSVWLRGSAALAILVLLGGIILTASRAGFLVTALMLLVLVLRGRGRAGLMLLVSIAGALLIFSSSAYWERIGTITAGEEAYNHGQSIEGRYDLAASGISLFVRNPVFGVGPGNFGEAYLEHRLGGEVLRSERVAPVAHNMYVQMLVEAGFVGVLLFMYLLYSCCTALLALRRVQLGGDSPLDVHFELSLLSLAAMGLTLSQAHNSILWLVLGLGGAAMRIVRQSNLSGRVRLAQHPPVGCAK